jgi:hypothetical protein
MRGKIFRFSTIGIFVMMIAALFLFSGCSALKSKKSSSQTGSAGQATVAKPKTTYYDFGDILLPSELKIVKEDSFVFRTPGLAAGVLSLKGRVEINSLINFFENKMPVDGWQAISSFKAPRTMMLYKKQARWCVISITEGQLSTRVEIWVAPTVSEAETGLHK